MKKSFSVGLMLIVLCICLLGVLSACDVNDDNPNEAHKHSLEAVPGVSATCTEPGVLEHWRCKICDKLFNDENGTVEIETATISALGHDFYEGICTRCGAADPNDDTLLDGTELKNINISPQGLLTWSRLKIASKYSVKISSAEGDRIYEISKNEGSFDFAELPKDEQLRYGKNSVTLTAYQYQEEQIGDETIGDDVPVSNDSFLAICKNDGYSLMRTTYADENLTIDGAYSDVKTDEYGSEYILIDKEIPQGSNDVSFNLSRNVKAAENVTVKYYKSASDRSNDKNAISGFNWYTEVVKAGNNYYYLRVTCADQSIRDYTVKVCGVRYVTFNFMSFDVSGTDEDGYNVYQYDSVGTSAVLLENDYFDIASLYALIGEDKVIVDVNLNVYENNVDYMVPFSTSTSASASFSLFCADKTFIDAQKAETDLYKGLFNLTYSGWTNGKGNSWILTFNADSDETNLVVPSKIYGDKVVLTSNSFRNAENLRSVIFENGFSSLPDRLFANGCSALESVVIPASITSAYSLGDWMFSEDLKEQLTIYCEGAIDSDTWNRVPNQMAYFRTYINQDGASSTITVDGVQFKIDATVNEAEVISASGDNIVIPDIVKFGLKSYPVTAVKESANINANSVFLGKNIRYLGDAWFANAGMKVTVDEQNKYFVVFADILYKKETWEFVFIPSVLATILEIPQGVTEIPQNCFENHAEITQIVLPSSLEIVAANAFDGCVKLISAEAPAMICGLLPSWLESITVTEGNLPERVFSGKSALKTITLSKDVTRIGNMAFMNCISLSEITIPDSVISIGNDLFYGCKGLIVYCETMSRPSGWDTAWNSSCPVVWDCKNNEIADDGYIYKVINGLRYSLKDDIAKVLQQPQTLADDIAISDAITYGDHSYTVTEIVEYAFEGCSQINSITIPESVTKIGRSAFWNCSLAKVNIADISAWCAIDFADEYANPLSSGGDLYVNGSLLTELVIPNGTTELGEYAFYNTSIQSVYIPSSVTRIGKYAFASCESLNKVAIADMKAWCEIRFADVASNPLSYATELYLNENLVTNLVVPEGTNTIRAYAFYNATSLTSVTIPDSVTAIGKRAFENCTSLEEVRINDVAAWCGIFFDGEMANPLLYAESLYLNDSLVTELEIPEGQQKIEQYVFSNYKALFSVKIPQSVEFIGTSAFAGCSGLIIYCETAEEPSGWEYGWNSSSRPVVWDCNNNDATTDGCVYTVVGGLRYALKNGEATVERQSQKLSGDIVIPEIISYNSTQYSVTSVVESAFKNCNLITGISLPAGVSVGSDAFYGCSGLNSAAVPADIIARLPKATIKTLNIVSGTTINAGALSGFSVLENLTIPFVGTSNGSGYPFGVIFGTNAYEGGVQTKQSYTNASTGTVEKTYYIPATLRAVTVTGGDVVYKAFANCVGLVSVTFSAEVTTVGSVVFGYGIYNLTVYCEAQEKPTGWDSAWNDYNPIVWNCNHNNTADDGYIYTVIGDLRYALKDGVATVAQQGQLLSGDIVIPDAINYDETSYAVTSIGSFAFYNCGAVTSVAIPESVTSIGGYAFSGCTSLSSVTFENPNGWWFSSSSTETSGTSISSSDLADPATATRYLGSVYCSYYWKRG